MCTSRVTDTGGGGRLCIPTPTPPLCPLLPPGGSPRPGSLRPALAPCPRERVCSALECGLLSWLRLWPCALDLPSVSVGKQAACRHVGAQLPSRTCSNACGAMHPAPRSSPPVLVGSTWFMAAEKGRGPIPWEELLVLPAQGTGVVSSCRESTSWGSGSPAVSGTVRGFRVPCSIWDSPGLLGPLWRLGQSGGSGSPVASGTVQGFWVPCSVWDTSWGSGFPAVSGTAGAGSAVSQSWDSALWSLPGEPLVGEGQGTSRGL